MILLAYLVREGEMKNLFIICRCVCILGLEAVYFGTVFRMYKNIETHISTYQNLDIIL